MPHHNTFAPANNFEQLAYYISALPLLLSDAIREGAEGAHYCRLQHWGSVKRRLSHLVGRYASSVPGEWFRGSEPYELAARYLLDHLPPCRGGCGHDEDWYDVNWERGGREEWQEDRMLPDLQGR
jgi:hypothetical protein